MNNQLKKCCNMKTKEYNFSGGFTIKPRLSPDGVVFAMGETHVCESKLFDLYQGKNLIETYDTFEEAKTSGVEISKDNVIEQTPRLRGCSDSAC